LLVAILEVVGLERLVVFLRLVALEGRVEGPELLHTEEVWLDSITVLSMHHTLQEIF
jgi:hypothetical protein